jgi:molecular chaperone DnaJ
LFEREGPHLFLNLPISYTQAVLGATLDVPTMARSASITVPAGTASGQVFQLNGLGMPQPRGGGRGNLVVRVFVEVPKKVGRRQEELLRELAEIEDKDVTPHRQSILERLKNCFASHPPEKEKSKREEETK